MGECRNRTGPQEMLKSQQGISRSRLGWPSGHLMSGSQPFMSLSLPSHSYTHIGQSLDCEPSLENPLGQGTIWLTLPRGGLQGQESELTATEVIRTSFLDGESGRHTWHPTHSPFLSLNIYNNDIFLPCRMPLMIMCVFVVLLAVIKEWHICIKGACVDKK